VRMLLPKSGIARDVSVRGRLSNFVPKGFQDSARNFNPEYQRNNTNHPDKALGSSFW
jgi:hypothetical protein